MQRFRALTTTLILAFGLGLASLALASPEVLLPAIAERLERAFADKPGGLELRDASCEADKVEARFCTTDEGAETCLDVVLTNPNAGCSARVVGPWCVSVNGALLPASRQAALDQALASLSQPSPWSLPVDREPLPSLGWRATKIALIALLLLFGPLVVGWSLGRVVARRSWVVRAGLVAVASTLLPLLAWGLVLYVPTFSAWDQVSLAVLTVVGLALGAFAPRPLPRGALASLAFGLLVGAALLEVGARLILSAPPGGDIAEVLARAHVTYDPRELEGVCRALFPSEDRLYSLEFDRVASLPAVVLHIGDSMVGNAGRDGVPRFANVLDERHEDVSHVAVGVGGAGVDAYEQLVKRWTRPSVRAVVVHLFPGNDLSDIDRPYPCCGGGPLFSWEGGAPHDRCLSSDWRYDRREYFAHSPVPLYLRLLANYSTAAAEVGGRLDRTRRSMLTDWANGVGEGLDEGTDETWVRFRVLMQRMRDAARAAGVELYVAVVPFRGALSLPDPTTAPTWRIHERMLSVTRELGMHAYDSWPYFLDLVRTTPVVDLFHNTPAYDCHFNRLGHERYAAWLRETLPAYLFK